MHQHAFKLSPDTHFSRPGPSLCGTTLPDNSVDADGRRERRQPTSAGQPVQIRLIINFRFIIHLRLPKNCYYPDRTVEIMGNEMGTLKIHLEKICINRFSTSIKIKVTPPYGVTFPYKMKGIGAPPRDRETRDRETRDSQTRDSQTRDSETRDSETRNSETQDRDLKKD